MYCRSGTGVRAARHKRDAQGRAGRLDADDIGYGRHGWPTRNPDSVRQDGCRRHQHGGDQEL